MNHIDIQGYVERLKEIKQELLRIVDAGVDSALLQCDSIIQNSQIATSDSSLISKLKSIFSRKKGSMTEDKDCQKKKFKNLSSEINCILSKTYSEVAVYWETNFLSSKEELKKLILQLDIDVDKKDKLMNAAINTAIIELSDRSLVVELNNAVTKANIEEFKSIILMFSKEYRFAIESVCKKQIEYWSVIDEID